MPSRYHPIEDGLWDDPKFDAQEDLPDAPFEERAFFAFLVSNPRQRPAGLYRASDEQLATGSRLPVARVRKLMVALMGRRLIVRDGAWVFLPGYLSRQARGPRLLAGAEADVCACSSRIVLIAFVERYPLYKNWAKDRLQPSTSLSGDLACACASEQYHPTPPQTTSEEPPLPPAGGIVGVNGFDALWDLHPGPKGPKGEALKAYGQAKPPEEAVEAMRAQLAYRAECDRRGKFCPEFQHLHRWIKKQRWKDEIPGFQDAPAQAVPPPDPKTFWKSREEYTQARKAGRVSPSQQVPEWNS